jgi:hypothetical protein
MSRTVVNLLLVACLISLAYAAPVEDEVHFPISGYNNHKWYSGIPSTIQAISTSPLVTTTTFSSTLNVTLITILLCFGSTVDPVARV